MQTTALCLAFSGAVAIAATTLSGCCGYGGPGCGSPALLGACSDQVSPETTSLTVVFGDDTGYHPSDYGEITAAPDKSLRVRRGSELGEIIVTARAPGDATLTIADIPGWDDTVFTWPLTIVSASDPILCEEQDGAGLLPRQDTDD